MPLETSRGAPGCLAILPAVSWWQEYQGLFVLGAFVVVLYVGARVRRWQRRRTDEAIDNAVAGVTWDQLDSPVVAKALASLATVVHLPVGLDRASEVLDGVKPGIWWSRAEPHELRIDEETVAVLEPDGEGTRLALLRAKDSGGIPSTEGDWRRLRRKVVAAAQAAGIDAREAPGPRLVRTPLVDLGGLSPAEAAVRPHSFRRAPN